MSRLFSEEEIYEKFRPYVSSNDLDKIMEEMTETKAVVIPDDATNGEVFMAMFPSAIDKNVKPTNKIHFMDDFKGELYGIGVISLDWWNAPYKEEVEE